MEEQKQIFMLNKIIDNFFHSDLTKGRYLLLLLRIRSGHLASGPRYSSFLRNLLTNAKVF